DRGRSFLRRFREKRQADAEFGADAEARIATGSAGMDSFGGSGTGCEVRPRAYATSLLRRCHCASALNRPSSRWPQRFLAFPARSLIRPAFSPKISVSGTSDCGKDHGLGTNFANA